MTEMNELATGTGGGRVRNSLWLIFICLVALAVGLFLADLAVGSSGVGLGELLGALFANGDEGRAAPSVRLMLDIRLSRALTAVMAGAALTVSGLQMQSLFRNPLAGPYVLGISSGASLGVALLVMGLPVLGLSAGGLSGSFLAQWGTAGAAWVGSAAVLAIVAAVSRRIKDIMVVLILGMMFSAATGAVVQALQYLSPEGNLKQFMIWTMGSLGETTRQDLWVMAPAVVAGLLAGLPVLKPLNLMALGEDYALSSGADLRRMRNLTFLSTTLLTGSVTAFCGPIGFIGLAMPHVCRFLTRSSDQRVLFPCSVLVGACSLLLCDIACKASGMPLNAVASLLGIPVVVWVVVRQRGG